MSILYIILYNKRLNNKHIKVASMLDYAEDLIKWFVISSSNVFDEIFPTYNVHSILHVVDDVRNFKISELQKHYRIFWPCFKEFLVYSDRKVTK